MASPLLFQLLADPNTTEIFIQVTEAVGGETFLQTETFPLLLVRGTPVDILLYGSRSFWRQSNELRGLVNRGLVEAVPEGSIAPPAPPAPPVGPVYVLANGGQPLTDIWNVGGFAITGLPSPGSPSAAATRAYVDSVIGGNNWQSNVLAIQNDPPSSPTQGDRYIVGTSPTSVWAGHANAVTTFDGSAWQFVGALFGFTLFNVATSLLVTFTTSWVTLNATLSHGLLTGLSANDHPQYQLGSEKGAASGYAGLDGSALVPTTQLPVFTSGALGAVPASGGSSANWLNAVGTWRAIRQSDIVPTFAINSFAGPSTREVGQSLVTPAFTASYNRTPTSAVLTDNAGSSPKTVTSTPTSFASDGTFTKTVNNNSIVFTLSANDGVDPTVNANATVAWQPKVFFGADVTVGSATQAFILALPSNALAPNRNRTFSASPGVGQNIYYAIPSSYGTPVFTVGGFVGGFSLVGTVAVTNSFGVTQNYDLWKSDNTNLGATTVVVT